MTRRPEPPTHATGAHRAPSRAPRAVQPPVVQHVEHPEHVEHADTTASVQSAEPGEPAGDTVASHPVPNDPLDDTLVEGLARDAPQPHGSRATPPAADSAPSPYEPWLDGLFTYCLSVLREHESAVAALGGVLALAERRADRAPAAEEAHRVWLYALARWECLRRLAEPGPRPAPGAAGDARARAELALLAWPEAAGTTAEQREALELAVRHGLAPHEVAAVLRLDHNAARTLLSTAACEVERTRTALAVVESGRCPVVARFTGETEVLLGAALRRELVRHVDECADCRRTAERANAGEPWPGTAASSAPLPVLEAPRPGVRAALHRALGARPQRRRQAARAMPRFDRGGFPLAPKDRAARRGRLRSRAVTTTVVATVIAAPVLALWAAYRGGPSGDEQGAAPVSATETDSLGGSPHEGAYDGSYGGPYDGTYGGGPFDDGHGGAGRARGAGASASVGHRFPDVSVAVVGPDGKPVSGPPAPAATPPAAAVGAPLAPAARGPVLGPGRLTVEAQPSGTVTLVTLTASGGEPVSWSMSADAPWLRLSQPGGVLRPGQSVTITVEVDHAREPAGPWRARVAVAPGGAAVTIEGCGAPPEPTPTVPAHPSAPPPATSPAPVPAPEQTHRP